MNSLNLRVSERHSQSSRSVAQAFVSALTQNQFVEAAAAFAEGVSWFGETMGTPEWLQRATTALGGASMKGRHSAEVASRTLEGLPRETIASNLDGELREGSALHIFDFQRDAQTFSLGILTRDIAKDRVCVERIIDLRRFKQSVLQTLDAR